MGYPWADNTVLSAEDLNTAVQFANGTISITTVANTLTTGTITFPFTFTTTPTVHLTVNSGSPAQITSYTVSSISTTVATVNIIRTNATATIINWFAVAAVN